MVSAMSASASTQFLPTSYTSHAQNSSLRFLMISLARNNRLARSSIGTFFHVSKALSAACIAGSTCSLSAFWWMPTISLGCAGLRLLILAGVFTSRPPMIKSYSRPSSPLTLRKAACIARTLSGCVKSVNGSFLKDDVGVMVRVSSAVAMHLFYAHPRLCASAVRFRSVLLPLRFAACRFFELRLHERTLHRGVHVERVGRGVGFDQTKAPGRVDQSRLGLFLFSHPVSLFPFS